MPTHPEDLADDVYDPHEQMLLDRRDVIAVRNAIGQLLAILDSQPISPARRAAMRSTLLLAISDDDGRTELPDDAAVKKWLEELMFRVKHRLPNVR